MGFFLSSYLNWTSYRREDCSPDGKRERKDELRMEEKTVHLMERENPTLMEREKKRRQLNANHFP